MSPAEGLVFSTCNCWCVGGVSLGSKLSEARDGCLVCVSWGRRGIGTVEEPETEEDFLMVFPGPGHLFCSAAVERCFPVVRRGECATGRLAAVQWQWMGVDKTISTDEGSCSKLQPLPIILAFLLATNRCFTKLKSLEDPAEGGKSDDRQFILSPTGSLAFMTRSIFN